MSTTLFLAAIAGLLFAPGPTNTLMALAGVQAFRQVPRLIPAEVLGYMTTVLPLAWLGGSGIGQVPGLALCLKVAAIAWVVYLALRLWDPGAVADRPVAVTGWRVYFTTVLNPKAAVVGLTLLPAMGEADFAPRLAIFAGAVVVLALAWGAAGSISWRQGRGRLRVVQRIASVWLAIVSATMAAGVLSGASA